MVWAKWRSFWAFISKYKKIRQNKLNLAEKETEKSDADEPKPKTFHFNINKKETKQKWRKDATLKLK